MDQNLGTFVRIVTLAAAELAFFGLVVSFVWRTASAKAGVPPDLPDVQVSAAGALAVALGGGYAITLGVPSGADAAKVPATAAIKALFKEKLWLSLGVLAYMVAGLAACVVYGLHEAETPGILRTIAVGFGGYVIAYVGMAYRQLNQ